MTSPWSDYLGTLRELHQERAAATNRSEHTGEELRARDAQLAELAARVQAQERRVVSLAAKIRKPVNFRDPAALSGPPAAGPAGGQLAWEAGVGELTEQLHGADAAAQDLEYYAARPTLLPAWPAWARNAVIYFVYSLPNVVLNCFLWVFYYDETAMRQFTVVAWGCCFWPVAAVVAGIATIRVVGVPRLPPTQVDAKGWEKPQSPTVAVHLPLGFAVTLGTSIGSGALLWLLGSAIG